MARTENNGGNVEQFAVRDFVQAADTHVGRQRRKRSVVAYRESVIAGAFELRRKRRRLII